MSSVDKRLYERIAATNIYEPGMRAAVVDRITPNVFIGPTSAASLDYIENKTTGPTNIIWVSSDMMKKPMRDEVEVSLVKVSATDNNLTKIKSSMPAFGRLLHALYGTPTYVLCSENTCVAQALFVIYAIGRKYMMTYAERKPHDVYRLVSNDWWACVGLFDLLKSTRRCTQFTREVVDHVVWYEKQMKETFLDRFEGDYKDSIVTRGSAAETVKATLEKKYQVVLSSGPPKKFDTLDDIPVLNTAGRDEHASDQNTAGRDEHASDQRGDRGEQKTDVPASLVDDDF